MDSTILNITPSLASSTRVYLMDKESPSKMICPIIEETSKIKSLMGLENSMDQTILMKENLLKEIGRKAYSKTKNMSTTEHSKTIFSMEKGSSSLLTERSTKVTFLEAK